jgi:type IV pilus assembly protein PilA
MTADRQAGFTLIELLITVAIVGVVAAIAVPTVLRARQSGNEASAIGSVRSINSAQAAFAVSCGGGGYAMSLTGLGTAPAGGMPFISADLVVADPAVKSGYRIASTGGGVQVLAAADTCNGAESSMTEYFASGVPVVVGSTGQRSFASDHRGTIYQDPTGAAIANPIPDATQTLQ